MTEPALDMAAFERLLEITGGDVEFLDELVDTYLEDAETQLAALRQAVADDDPAAILRPAHTLKSSSANVGAMTVSDLSRDLEADARTGVVPDMAARVEACATAVAAARTALLATRDGR
jgi:HPt (histidine-containing phosphotransfer) domain-containing protein